MTVTITHAKDGFPAVSVSDGDYQVSVTLFPGEFVTLTGDRPRIVSGSTGVWPPTVAPSDRLDSRLRQENPNS